MNIYEIIEPENGLETFVTLHQTKTLKIEVIRSRLTLPGEMYDQNEDEWVVLIRGSAILEVEGTLHHFIAGDTLLLARHTRHRVLSTSDDALWLGIFSS